MTRRIALALGAVGLVVYAALRIEAGHGVVQSVVGAALGIVVLALLARRG
jgi:hypothetical protein